MYRGKNIDNLKALQIKSKAKATSVPKFSIGLTGLVNELRSFFVNMHKKCELIEQYLGTIDHENSPEITKSTETDSQITGNRISIIDLINRNSSESEESMALGSFQEDDLPKFRNKTILTYFIDDSRILIKENKRKSSESLPRKYPKLAYFKIKLMRLYAKSVKLILKPKKKIKNDYEDLLGLNADDFTENTLRKKEFIHDIIGCFKGNSKKNGWYKELFRENQDRTENFRLFLENLFRQDINKFIKRFGFKCCQNQQHLSSCIEKWRLLRDWIFKNITGYYF